MKSKLLRIAQAILLVLTGALAWGAVGKAAPSSFGVGQVLTASASALSVQPTGPATPLASVGSGFTYQGRLLDAGNPANGTYDFQYALWNALTGGAQVGGTVTVAGVSVTGGLFTVTLDFGSTAFDGNGRWLEIAVQHNGGGYTTLSPRQPLTPTPYALFALKTQGYKNVVVVAKAGGDFTSIQPALDSITDASASNHYLVWVAPGIYTESVTMKRYVDIEGSGEKVTKITYTGSSSNNTSTVVGASNAELRSLTVENTGGNTYAIAIYNSHASPSLLHVTATASGGSNNYGVYNDTASPTMTNVTATVSGVSSSAYSVYNDNSSPTMTNVTATASGLFDTVGVYNDNSSSPTMTNVTATASSGSNSNIGVNNDNSSSPTMTNVTATASGPSTNVGVANRISSPTMNNVTAIASDGTSNYGVFNLGSASPRINNSTLTGSTSTIFTNSGSTARVGASKLSGGPASSGTTCAGVFDENYVFYASTCP